MNDMRLGDLDALLDKFLRSYTEQEKVGNFQFVACEIKQGFADMVCEQPTIDAIPVVLPENRIIAGRNENGQFYSDLTGEEVANILNAYASGMLELVVRCGECERRNKSADLTDTIYCPCLKLQMRKTDFCSYGERKDGDGE